MFASERKLSVTCIKLQNHMRKIYRKSKRRNIDRNFTQNLIFNEGRVKYIFLTSTFSFS